MIYIYPRSIVLGSVFGGSDQNSSGAVNDELQNKIWTLTSHNNHLIKQLTEKVPTQYTSWQIFFVGIDYALGGKKVLMKRKGGGGVEY